jgi:TetR/AcrR family transcriptional repressor of nem operon
MGRTSNARELLIESASELWHSRSYADVGVNEICEHAGVRKGSFYHFFASKQDLALAVIDSFWSRAKTRLLVHALDPEAQPLEKLVKLIDSEYQVQRSLKDSTGSTFGCPFGNLAGEMSTQDDVLRRRLTELFYELAEYFERILDEAVAAGEIPAQNTRATAIAIEAYVEGMLLLAKTANDPELIRQLAPGILRLTGATPQLAEELVGAPPA